MGSFTDQHVLITGATRGIGRAISTAFLEEGAHVAGIYGGDELSANKMKEELGELASQLSLYQCDVSDEKSVKNLYMEIEERYSSLEVLVNNAGIRKDSVMALMPAAEWQRVLDVNLTGTFLMAKEAVLLMMRNKYGRIINITSPVSHLGFVGQANYAASKAGQVALTKSLSKETARKKITVNCVSPGFIATDFIDDLSKEQLQEYKKYVPMRRFGTTEEVADAVLFLASQSSSYITGSVLEVTGGL